MKDLNCSTEETSILNGFIFLFVVKNLNRLSLKKTELLITRYFEFFFISLYGLNL